MQEGNCTPHCKGLEASLVPTLHSKDVWVIDPALAEAISGGLLCTHAYSSQSCARKLKEHRHCVSLLNCQSQIAQLSTTLQITKLYVVAFTLTFIVIVICLHENKAFCCAGMSRSNSSNIVVRRPGSIGYRVETVCVEQLQDVWHPLKWGDSDEVCTAQGCCSFPWGIIDSCDKSSGN